MRNLALALVALFTVITASAQPIATRTTALAWDNPNLWTDTSNFVFTAYSVVSGGAAGVQVGKATAVTNSLPLIALMVNSPNGTFFVNGITVGNSGLASDNSTNFTFQWFGTIAIQTQPQSLSVKNGDVATFTVTTIGGAGTVSYQWLKNGLVIPGANSQTFVITNARPSDNGFYNVMCADSTASVPSQAATLIVIPKPNSPVNIRLTP